MQPPSCPAAPRAVPTGVDLIVESGDHAAVGGPFGAVKPTLVALAGGDLLPAAVTVCVAGTASPRQTRAVPYTHLTPPTIA